MSSANRLVHEQSPYLLQHAYNPVNWYPWGADAFEKAAREDKPVFLSIGYSTCHWCHVMERESFEDETVARLMNEAFVNIKVDREERPDIDQIYMTVAQMTTGHGGWPLTILMTPDRKPFFAATYIPRESRYGRPGMLDLVPRVRELWTTDHDRILDSADRLTDALRAGAAQDLGTETVGPRLLDEAFAQLTDRFDAQFGGFGEAPKFPTPHHLTFLLREAVRRDGDAADAARTMVETTLQGMRAGGVYDQVGFGFHRYSTDRVWLVPHFEKMLYDQAGLLTAYAEAYQATRDEHYAATAREIVRYVERDLTDPEGGFYSAEDADSEGEEGRFYVWTVEELVDVLGPEEAAVAIAAFGVEDEGNFLEESTRERTGANILNHLRPPEVVADALGLSPDALAERLQTIRERLLDRRAGRVRPGLDDKVLTDWNGLMIAALAVAARALDEPAYADMARRAADFVRRTLRAADGRLLHRFRAGHVGIRANLDDYAFLIHGLVELFQATFDPADLADALALADRMIERFADPAGGFFFTPDDGEALLVRQKEAYDGALPSGNAVAALSLLRLARMTGRTELENRAVETVRAFGKVLERAASGFTFMLQTVQFLEGPAHEVVVVGDPAADDTRAMLRVLRDHFLPHTVVLLRRPGDGELPGLAPFTVAQTALDGRATAYVCRNFACDRPTTDVSQMLTALRE